MSHGRDARTGEKTETQRGENLLDHDEPDPRGPTSRPILRLGAAVLGLLAGYVACRYLSALPRPGNVREMISVVVTVVILVSMTFVFGRFAIRGR